MPIACMPLRLASVACFAMGTLAMVFTAHVADTALVMHRRGLRQRCGGASDGRWGGDESQCATSCLPGRFARFVECERACAEGGFGLCAYGSSGRECWGFNADVSGACSVQSTEGWRSFETCGDDSPSDIDSSDDADDDEEAPEDTPDDGDDVDDVDVDDDGDSPDDQRAPPLNDRPVEPPFNRPSRPPVGAPGDPSAEPQLDTPDGAPPASSRASQCSTTVLSQGFDGGGGGGGGGGGNEWSTWREEDAAGALSGRDGNIMFGGYIDATGDSNIWVGPDPMGKRGNVLRVQNPEGCLVDYCAAGFELELPQTKAATLKYAFMFGEGYGFNRGGKLPGLCSYDCPSGCDNEELGFSARLMWYNENGVDPDLGTAQLASYSYWGEENEGERCGTYWFYEGVEIVAGKWYDLEMFLRMNDEGQANGVQKITLNGKEVNNEEGVDWSVDFDNNAFIEKFTFRAFHGGSSGWESPGDQYIFFDDFSIVSHDC